MIGIYKITNPKGKIYIGQSIDIEKRIRSYKNINCKFQILLYNSISKYSWEKHMFEIVEECSLEQLNEKEIYWGTYYNVLNKGLNLRLGNGKGVVSEETKQKQREAKLGHKQSKETIEKRSKTLKNIPKPDGFGEKHSLLMKGKSKPKDFGEKISKAKKGIPLPLGTGDKISKSRSKQVIQLDKNNQIINTFPSVKEASKYINVHEINMRLHIGGKYKTCRGYIFKYKNND